MKSLMNYTKEQLNNKLEAYYSDRKKNPYFGEHEIIWEDNQTILVSFKDKSARDKAFKDVSVNYRGLYVKKATMRKSDFPYRIEVGSEPRQKYTLC